MPTRPTRHRLLVPWVVLAVGIPASILLFSVIQDAVEDVARLRFERSASDAKHVIEARVRSYTDVLYGLQALFATQDSISRVQFRRYVESLDLKQRYPGFDVVNYAVHVSAKDKEYFEEAVRRDTTLDPHGYPEFAIKPPGTRPEHFVMVYVEPMAGFEYAFGLDLGANPGIADPQALAATMRSARDSGKLTASGLPIRVKGATEYIGLAMRLPVFRSGQPTDTVEQRRASYLGSVGAGFNVANLMRGVLNEKTASYLRFRLYDVGSAGGNLPPSSVAKKWLLFDSNQSTQTSSASIAAIDPASVFTRVLPMELGGRMWEVHFNAPDYAIIERVDALLPWLALAGGLLSSVLLFGMFYSLASSRSRAVGIANEITKDLRDSTEQLQAMSRRLVDAQESERRQLSRELHDRVGQNLTALSINLDILKTQMAGNGNAAFCPRLDDAASLLEATAGAIENVMSELRPPMLDDYGLLPALQWYANEFSGRTGIQVSVDGDEGMERLTQASEIALFRIMQEALNNVAKHAHATSIRITLERSSARFMMTVADDGVGLNTTLLPLGRRRPGLGMVTMRERAQAAGGQFEIEAAAGCGTRVVVRIPH
ncbi:MAG: CHASE domain-containing protein [Betaproteobacteria bacterium]|nr:CHASE domain-containing protein [Betaproteobacteria bacterium]